MRSGGYRLHTSTILDVDIERAFGFFKSAENLECITPRWLRFKILTPTPIEVYEGTRIEYQLRIHGVPVKWVSEIRDWNPPYSFTDVQIRGPYKQWTHLHRFSELEDERVLMVDIVDYRVPFGRLVHGALVKRDLRKIFEFRQRTVTEIMTKSRLACQ